MSQSFQTLCLGGSLMLFWCNFALSAHCELCLLRSIVGVTKCKSAMPWICFDWYLFNMSVWRKSEDFVNLWGIFGLIWPTKTGNNFTKSLINEAYWLLCFKNFPLSIFYLPAIEALMWDNVCEYFCVVWNAFLCFLRTGQSGDGRTHLNDKYGYWEHDRSFYWCQCEGC